MPAAGAESVTVNAAATVPALPSLTEAFEIESVGTSAADTYAFIWFFSAAHATELSQLSSSWM